MNYSITILSISNVPEFHNYYLIMHVYKTAETRFESHLVPVSLKSCSSVGRFVVEGNNSGKGLDRFGMADL